MISQASDVPVASAEGSDDAYLVRGYLLKLSGGLNSRAKYDRRFIRLRNDEIARHIQYFDTAYVFHLSFLDCQFAYFSFTLDFFYGCATGDTVCSRITYPWSFTLSCFSSEKWRFFSGGRQVFTYRAKGDDTIKRCDWAA